MALAEIETLAQPYADFEDKTQELLEAREVYQQATADFELAKEKAINASHRTTVRFPKELSDLCRLDYWQPETNLKVDIKDWYVDLYLSPHHTGDNSYNLRQFSFQRMPLG